MHDLTRRPFLPFIDCAADDSGARLAAYHRHLGGLFFLDAAGVHVLQEFVKPQLLPEHIPDSEAQTRQIELIQQMILRRVLVPSSDQGHSVFVEQEVTKKVSSIRLILANACNFGCTYCFEGVQGKKMSAEDEVDRLDESRLIAREGIKVNIEDSIYASKERFDDERYIHYASDIEAASGSTGYRDIWVINRWETRAYGIAHERAALKG